MLDSLGVMLKYNNNLNQNDIINKQDSRAKAIEERRKRIEEAQMQKEVENNMEQIRADKAKDNSNGLGLVGKMLAMSTGTSFFIGNLTAIVEGLEKAGVSSMEGAYNSIKKIDPSAKEDDINGLLELLSDKVEKFNELVQQKEMENYELLNNIEYREQQKELELQEQAKIENNRNQIILDEINDINF